MTDATLLYVVWALVLGAVGAVSLPFGSLVGLNVRFPPRYIAIFAAFGAGALIAALSLELVAPTAFAITEHKNAESSQHAYAHFFVMLAAGGFLGGVVFVALDAVISAKGGYLRKTSTTLAYLAKRRREKIQKVMGAVP